MNHFLKNEIIRHIFASIGVTTTKLFGTVGLPVKDLCVSNKSVVLEYDDGKVEHPVYSGSLDLINGSVYGCLLDLSLNEDREYLFGFSIDDMPIHALKIVYDTDDLFDNLFMIYNHGKEEWVHADLFIQANVLSGFERINSLGVIWEPCDKTDHIYNAILKLAVNK